MNNTAGAFRARLLARRPERMASQSTTSRSSGAARHALRRVVGGLEQTPRSSSRARAGSEARRQFNFTGGGFAWSITARDQARGTDLSGAGSTTDFANIPPRSVSTTSADRSTTSIDLADAGEECTDTVHWLMGRGVHFREPRPALQSRGQVQVLQRRRDLCEWRRRASW